jgi:hypothetical protein
MRWLAIGIVMLVAGCGGSKATPKNAPQSATAGGVRGALALSQTATLRGGVKATIAELAYPLAPKPRPGLITPTPGTTAYAGLRVQVCAGDARLDVTGFQFSLRLADNTRAGTSLGERDPAFVNATLAPGECNAGWVTFSVPLGSARPATAQYSVNGDIATWNLAQ